MKTRSGFVSNSSSTSFTCHVCGHECSGMDLGLEDAEMNECTNGHYFCDEHLVDAQPAEPQEGSDDYDDNENDVSDMSDDDDDDDSRYACPTNKCPICTMTAMSPKEELGYLRKKAGFANDKDTLVQVKAEFPSYEAFRAFLGLKG